MSQSGDQELVSSSVIAFLSITLSSSTQESLLEEGGGGDKTFYGSDEDEDDEEDEKEEKAEAAALAKRKPYVMDPDHRLLLRNTKPLLQSRNAAVRPPTCCLITHLTSHSSEASCQ